MMVNEGLMVRIMEFLVVKHGQRYFAGLRVRNGFAMAEGMNF